jgi:membrane associated rhomboid family serine protease
MIPLRDNINSRTIPFVNVLIIFANIAVFIHELKMPDSASLESFVRTWGFVPKTFLLSPFEGTVNLLASLFIHGGWMHILGNMLYLWIFGDNVEDRIGHFRYLLFYILVGSTASLSQMALHPESSLPLVGASGAIAGVMGAYFLSFPGAKILTLVPIFIFVRFVELPAFLFLAVWFFIQALQSWGSLVAPGGASMGGVAWAAHAGGFLSGAILIFIFRRQRGR